MSDLSRQKGFTIIELIVAIVVLLAAGGLIMLQKNDIDASHRDSLAKTRVNALYYNLEEVYYAANKSYPLTLTDATLPGIETATLNDPFGVRIGQSTSTLRYEPRNCQGETCAAYTLRADLEKEPDFNRSSTDGRTAEAS